MIIGDGVSTDHPLWLPCFLLAIRW